MKVTGYAIQNKMRSLRFARDVLYSELKDSIWEFPNESKRNPQDIDKEIKAVEEKIADLQVLQSRYNLSVTVDVKSKSMTLHEAVKKIGGASRLGEVWKDFSNLDSRNKRSLFYHSGPSRMNKDEVFSERKISLQDSAARAVFYTDLESALRSAIQTANGQEIEMEAGDLLS